VFNIEWLASYEIGVPEIDDDHKALLKSLTAIKDAFADRDYGLCRSLVAEFTSKAESHLEREEALLRDTGYPGADSHAELFARVAEIRDVCSGELEPLGPCRPARRPGGRGDDGPHRRRPGVQILPSRPRHRRDPVTAASRRVARTLADG